MWSCTEYHQRDHDGKAVSDFIGRLDENDRQTDGHPDHAPQEGSSPDQSERPGVDVHAQFPKRGSFLRSARTKSSGREWPDLHVPTPPRSVLDRHHSLLFIHKRSGQMFITLLGCWQPGVQMQRRRAAAARRARWAPTRRRSNRPTGSRAGKTETESWD